MTLCDLMIGNDTEAGAMTGAALRSEGARVRWCARRVFLHLCDAGRRSRPAAPAPCVTRSSTDTPALGSGPPAGRRSAPSPARGCSGV